jgi:hypothetical protein
MEFSATFDLTFIWRKACFWFRWKGWRIEALDTWYIANVFLLKQGETDLFVPLRMLTPSVDGFGPPFLTIE